MRHLEEIQLREKYLPEVGEFFIVVPKNIIYKLDRYVPKRDLTSINKDIDVAKDLIMIFVRNFTNSYVRSLNTTDPEKISGYKNVSYDFQREIFMSMELGFKNSPHPKIIKLLKKHGIIEKGLDYVVGIRSRQYRLTSAHRNRGLERYKLRSEKVGVKEYEKVSRLFNELIKRPISKNSLVSMLDIRFPTDEEAILELNKHVEDGYRNRDGKRLVWVGNNVGRYPRKEFVYAEDHLKILQIYRDVFRMPVVASKTGGYRVYDRYNMLPKTIRGLIRLGGEKVKNLDYICLHPNLSQTLYSSNPKAVTHRMVAEFLEEGFSDMSDKKQVEVIQRYKVAHLSFFNLPVDQMKFSIVYPYYEKNDLEFLRRIEDEKIFSEVYGDEKESLGYRITSKKMFGLEVELMGEVIRRLNKENIRALYIFDAISVNERDLKRAAEIMNDVAKEFNINTTVS